MEDCEMCENPGFDHEQWANEQMEKHGWYVHFVPDGDAVNAHTHGFDITFGQVDVQILFPLDPKIAHSVFATIAKNMSDGVVYGPGKHKNVIKNYEVEFVRAVEAERPVLRCILPDAEGRFPDDEDCPEVFRRQIEGTLRVV